MTLTDEIIDAIWGESPFTARLCMNKRAFEVVQCLHPEWRELIPNEDKYWKHHGFFPTYDEAEIAQRRLHTRWVFEAMAKHPTRKTEP